MYKDLEYIEVVFDNTEGLRIPANHIDRLEFSDITKQYISMLMPKFTLLNACSKARITFNKNANILDNFIVQYGEILPFDRLKMYDDIIWIVLSFTNGEEEELRMIGTQKYFEHEDGSITITIEKED